MRLRFKFGLSVHQCGSLSLKFLKKKNRKGSFRSEQKRLKKIKTTRNLNKIKFLGRVNVLRKCACENEHFQHAILFIFYNDFFKLTGHFRKSQLIIIISASSHI